MYIYQIKHFEFVFWPMFDAAWVADAGFAMFRFFPPEFYLRHSATNDFYRWWIRFGYFEVRRLRNAA